MTLTLLAAVQSKIETLNAFAKDFAKANNFNEPYIFEARVGKKYIKIVRGLYGQHSVWCFIDEHGQIFKPASWSAPAKNFPRGVVNDFDDYKFVSHNIFGF